MPRKPRYILPGQPQHVIIRGINREPIFYHDADYHYYLDRLSDAIVRQGCSLHAYVLMTNHVHLLLTPIAEQSIGKTIQTLGRYYVQYFNKAYERTGTLWEGRYKSALVDTEQYLLTCYRYIELNPVRAQMATHPSEYPWSSYLCNSIGQSNSLITAHNKYEELGHTDEERQRAYRALFQAKITERELEEIRLAANKEWVLGSDYFKAKIEQQLQRRTTPLPKGGDRKSKQYRNQHQINRH
jgi:putative transposase